MVTIDENDNNGDDDDKDNYNNSDDLKEDKKEINVHRPSYSHPSSPVRRRRRKGEDDGKWRK